MSDCQIWNIKLVSIKEIQFMDKIQVECEPIQLMSYVKHTAESYMQNSKTQTIADPLRTQNISVLIRFRMKF